MFRRSPAHAWILAAVAGVFGTIGGAVVIDVAGYGLDELLHPMILLFAGLPLAAATGLGLLAARAFRHRPVLVSLDAAGISLAGRPTIPWDDIGTVIVTETWVSYGPHQHITIRRRFTPSKIAATGAERLLHALFTDRSFAPSHVDRTVEEMLADIDAGLAAAGYARAEPPAKLFRLVQSVRRWEIRPTDAAPALR